LYQWIRYKSHANTEGKLMARLTDFHRQQRLNDQEVNQGEDGGENVVLPPPPPPVDLAQVLANQTLLMEAIFNAVNRPRPVFWA
jgi:hypothetical protein